MSLNVVRRLIVLPVLVLWSVASAFFAIVGWRVMERINAFGADRTAALGGARAIAVSAAYSLGGAAVLFGAAWLALPPARRGGLHWWALLWVGVTTALLSGRQVGGWPLVLASVVAFGIGLDVLRRLVLALVAPQGTHTIDSEAQTSMRL